MKLITVCIPSRNRPRGLHETIDSLFETADDKDFDVIVGIDDDDERTLAARDGFKKYGNVNFIVHPRGPKGYGSLCDVVTRIANAAATPWVSFIDDDMLILGKGWIEQIAKLPTEGVMAHCEFYWLDNSRYGPNSCGVVGPFVPNRCWEKFGHNRICHPHDDFLYRMCMKEGWENKILKGITLKHEWRKEDENQRPVRSK